MKLRLLKELKAAGFPFRHASKADKCFYTSGEPPLAVPSLEDLIDACGDDFVGVFRSQSKRGWMALKRGTRPDETQHFKGATLKEAVTHLWFALHPTNEANDEI